MTRVRYPSSSRRRTRALALGASILTLAAVLRGRPSAQAAASSPHSDGRARRPQHDLRSRPGTPVPAPSPRRRSRLRGALAVAAAVGVVALLALVVGPSTSRATIDWSSGFEGQTWAPWQGLQHQEDKPLSDSFRYVTSPVRTGSYAAQFSVPHGYGPYGGERTELCCGPSGEGTPGTDEYWAWSTLFPTSWTEPYKWGLFFQFHADDTMPPAIALDAGGDAVWADIRTGNINGSDTSYTNFPQILNTLSKGQWNDFVVHIHWAVDSTGTIQIWHRLAGQTDFSNVLDLSSIPTLQSRGGTSTGIYTKMGIYRASYCDTPAPGCSSPLGVQPTSTLYDDSLVRGSSFAEVVSAAWGGSSAAVSSATPAAPSTPAPPAPAPPAPAPSAPAPAAPAPSSGGGGSTGGASTTTAATPPAAAPATSASPTTGLATNGSKKGGSTSKAQATANARTLAMAVATTKARARRYARAAEAAGARARGYSLVAAAARAKARAYYRAAAKAEAEVRALTRPKRQPAFQPVVRLRPN